MCVGIHSKCNFLIYLFGQAPASRTTTTTLTMATANDGDARESTLCSCETVSMRSELIWKMVSIEFVFMRSYMYVCMYYSIVVCERRVQTGVRILARMWRAGERHSVFREGRLRRVSPVSTTPPPKCWKSDWNMTMRCENPRPNESWLGCGGWVFVGLSACVDDLLTDKFFVCIDVDVTRVCLCVWGLSLCCADHLTVFDSECFCLFFSAAARCLLVYIYVNLVLRSDVIKRLVTYVKASDEHFIDDHNDTIIRVFDPKITRREITKKHLIILCLCCTICSAFRA